MDARPFVSNPGYVTPPDGASTQYYFTARDEFRTEGQKRTDFSALYSYGIGAAGGTPCRPLHPGAVFNVFNQFQLCGCGGSAAFTVGGNVQNKTIDSAVRTNVSHPTLYQAFNPFTDDAGGGGALGEEPDVRPRAESLRVHDAAHVPHDVRRAVLVW